MTYRRDIDGLRALAVLSVLFYHAHLGFSGGFVGVDVFFVISGNLIYGQILKGLQEGRFSYIDFWERRIRRLVPALLVVTFFTAFTSYLILLPEDLVDLGKALIAQPLMLANVYFWRAVKGGYFADPPEIRPLLHTWSLGVEEQFYVFFPLLMMLAWRSPRTRKRAAYILGGLAAGSLMLSLLMTPVKSVFSFFCLPTRAWELLAGALLHHASRPYSHRSATIAAWSGFGLIIYSFFFFTGSTPFPGSAGLAPCVGTVLLLWSGGAGSGMGWLSSPVPVYVGRISYSLYLWHWPLIAYGDYLGLTDDANVRVLVVLLSVLLGHLSYRWVETPFRHGHMAKNRGSLLMTLLVYIVGSVSTGCLFVLGHGFPENWGPVRLPSIALEDTRKFINEFDALAPDERPIIIGMPDAENSTFLLWGDSHAMALGAAFDKMGHQYQMRGIQLTSSATPPLVRVSNTQYYAKGSEYLQQWSNAARELVRKEKIKAVFLVGAWSAYASENLNDDLTTTVDSLIAACPSQDLSVFFVKDVPLGGLAGYRAFWFHQRWGVKLSAHRTSEAEYLRINGLVEKAIAPPPKGCIVLDPAVLILELPDLQQNGKPLYADADHLTDLGALQVTPALMPAFDLLAKKREE